MKTAKYFIFGLATLALACKKPTPVPPPAPDAAALISFVNDNKEDATQHFSENAEAAIFVTGEKGTVLYIPANSLENAAGDLVTGNVDIELIEIDKKSEMVMMNKATTGKTASGQHATLVSDGEFYVSVSQYGEELTLVNPMTLRHPFEAYDGAMRKFVNTSADEDMLWEMAEDSLLDIDEDTTGLGIGYDILPGEWGWTNIDKFYSDPRPKTTIYAEVPEGFDDTNCEVYISYDGEPGALAQFDVWDGERFTEHYGLIPIGLEVHFIAVGIVDGDLHYSIHSATITADHVETIDDFSAIAEDALIALIDDLP